MQISEVIKPHTPQQQRMDQLRTQLDAAHASNTSGAAQSMAG
jgi:hypothetical protein